jgi:hypothetical protein
LSQVSKVLKNQIIFHQSKCLPTLTKGIKFANDMKLARAGLLSLNFQTDKICPMLKISASAVAILFMLISCNRENPDVVNAKPVGEKATIQLDSATNSENLAANSAQEGDLKGVATKALQPLQTVYKAASGKVPGIGEVTIMVDDNLNLIIENKAGSGSTTSTVNLRSIDTKMENIEIIPNKDDNKFPGFKIKTLPGQPKVAILKNGTKEKDLDYLEIFMAERQDVHKAITSLIFAAQAAQSSLPAEGAVLKQEASKK